MENIQQLAQDVSVEDVLDDNAGFGGIGSLVFMLGQVDDEPGYWSQARDEWLRKFYRRTDPIKLAVGTFVSKAVTIPVHVNPHDRAVKKHVRDAKFMQRALHLQSGLFRGFRREFSKFTKDFLTTDNGGFMLVMGGGPPGGPIVGPASGVMHLDSTRCWRTGNAEYPVVYTNTNGRLYRLHYTRIIAMSNLPEGDVEMHDVGLCPVSCCLMGAKEIRDVYSLSAEKMGSRPQRQVLYVEEGATIDQLTGAVKAAEIALDSQGLRHFAKTLMLAPKTAAHKLKLAKLDLTTTHEGFDRMDVTVLDMASIAAAFKLDLRDLAINFGVAGQTRADAEVQDRKGRGKGVGELLEAFIDELNLKFLPEHLYASFDNADDEQDEQQATIWNIRSQARDRDMTSGTTTPRVERLRMLRNNEITEEEFEELELTDGRMADGTDVLLLFYSEDPFSVADLVDVRNILAPPDTATVPTPAPTVKAEVPPAEPLPPDPALLAVEETKNEALDRIEDAIRSCSIALFNVTNSRLSRFLRWQMAALKKLKSLYEEFIPMPSTLGQDALIGDQQLLSAPVSSV